MQPICFSSTGFCSLLINPANSLSSEKDSALVADVRPQKQSKSNSEQIDDLKKLKALLFSLNLSIFSPFAWQFRVFLPFWSSNSRVKEQLLSANLKLEAVFSPWFYSKVICTERETGRMLFSCIESAFIRQKVPLKDNLTDAV